MDRTPQHGLEEPLPPSDSAISGFPGPRNDRHDKTDRNDRDERAIRLACDLLMAGVTIERRVSALVRTRLKP